MAEIHRVKQGDTIYTIANAKGFRSWEAIWEHEANAKLRELRSSPSVLHEGDEVHIPDKNVKPFSCATRQLHTFRLRRLTQRFAQDLRDENDEPLASVRYELDIDGTKWSGRTDGNGHLEHEIPLEAKEGVLKAWLREGADEHVLTWSFMLGHLDPITEVSGVQGRLANLGYDVGDPSGELDETTVAALKDFQSDNDLPITGEIDDATRAKLAEAYGA